MQRADLFCVAVLIGLPMLWGMGRRWWAERRKQRLYLEAEEEVQHREDALERSITRGLNDNRGDPGIQADYKPDWAKPE